MTDDPQALDTLAALLTAAQLAVLDEDRANIRALYRRYTSDRQRLAAFDVRTEEPLTIVALQAPTPEEP